MKHLIVNQIIVSSCPLKLSLDCWTDKLHVSEVLWVLYLISSFCLNHLSDWTNVSAVILAFVMVRWAFLACRYAFGSSPTSTWHAALGPHWTALPVHGSRERLESCICALLSASASPQNSIWRQFGCCCGGLLLCSGAEGRNAEKNVEADAEKTGWCFVMSSRVDDSHLPPLLLWRAEDGQRWRWSCVCGGALPACLLIGSHRRLPFDLLESREQKKRVVSWQLDVCGEFSVSVWSMCVCVCVCAGHGFSFRHNLNLKSSCCRAHDQQNWDEESCAEIMQEFWACDVTDSDVLLSAAVLAFDYQ